METTPEALIEKIEQGYTQLVRLYRSVPVTALLEPTLANGWSVKDVLSHIAAWEWRCASLLNESHQSDLPLKAMPDVEALNREFFQERQGWSWAEVEDDFRQAHQAMLAAIRAMPPARLTSKIVQQSIAEETWEHYTEHLPDLERWHKQTDRR
ncbi:MAG: maleylpyruvate isomerase N-terminal domain-containing protein [Anaerolineae bacterium]|nr:maleylpyruvate isomerase N-terminal domain-containing protein [Anaerolineae bacterium]